MSDWDRGIGKIKPLFTRAHPPASPRLAPVSPLEFPSAAPPRQQLVSACGGRAGRPPHATRAPWCTGAANVWDGGHGTVATLWHTRRRFNAEGGDAGVVEELRLGLDQTSRTVAAR